MSISTDEGPATTGARVHVFVYGTLMHGQPENTLLRAAERVREARVTGTLYDVDGQFPALVLAGTDVVHGEIWRCAPDTLYELDRYEDVAGGLFRRVALRIDDLACWTYVAGGALATRLSPDRRIPAGSWAAFVRSG
ncbi:MAG TPA: gamma-glutamylcyclotransferase family protein, partial [Longimicrobiales bacterium]|nr:gamma-glutamylcyclotransferase family protein [Longimicrobiales bacterium]